MKLFYLSMILFMANLQTGKALNCYQCGSKEKVACYATGASANLKQCPSDQDQYCVYEYTITDGVNHVRKYCSNQDENECNDQLHDHDSTSRLCSVSSCNVDGCNRSGIARISLIALSMAIILPLFVQYI